MYQYTRDCMIGIVQLDNEHRELFRMINEVERAIQLEHFDMESVQILVNALQDYAKNHFAHEEEYMAEIGDPELERQKKEHANFAAKMDSMKLDLRELDESHAKTALADLLEYLARWLYRHILSSDIMIGKMHQFELNDDSIFDFKDSYKVGIEVIDDEHKKLFEIIRRTNSIIHDKAAVDMYDQMLQILSELKEYAKMHFADEEAYMERIHYEGLQGQRWSHEAFVDRLSSIHMEDIDEDNQQETLEELVEFLFGWLQNHILMSDKLIPAVKLVNLDD